MVCCPAAQLPRDLTSPCLSFLIRGVAVTAAVTSRGAPVNTRNNTDRGPQVAVAMTVPTSRGQAQVRVRTGACHAQLLGARVPGASSPRPAAHPTEAQMRGSPGAHGSDASAQFHGRVKGQSLEARRKLGAGHENNLAPLRERNVSPAGFLVLREPRPLLIGGGSQVSPELSCIPSWFWTTCSFSS